MRIRFFNDASNMKYWLAWILKYSKYLTTKSIEQFSDFYFEKFCTLSAY